MSQGYSLNLVEANRQVNQRHLGVALGRVCIAARVQSRTLPRTSVLVGRLSTIGSRGSRTPTRASLHKSKST